MRLLFTIPHYFDPEGDGRHGSTGRARAEERAAALGECIAALHRQFGEDQGIIDIASKRLRAANTDAAHEIQVVVHTIKGKHLLGALPVSSDLYETRFVSDPDPRMLGFTCHETLLDGGGDYHFYCYLEDDLVIHDPWFFAKLRWFLSQVGTECVLQPNRFEVDREGRGRKIYVDGDLAPEVTEPFEVEGGAGQIGGQALGRKISFRRALNPHAGCFFLGAEQMTRWADSEHFRDRDTSFVGPLESAATLGLLKTFRVYKAAPHCANFLEVEHRDDAFLRMTGP